MIKISLELLNIFLDRDIGANSNITARENSPTFFFSLLHFRNKVGKKILLKGNMVQGLEDFYLCLTKIRSHINFTL